MDLINKTGKSKGFTFIVTPENVHQDLLKLDGIDLLGRKLLIKEAISTRKKDPKQSKRPNFVVNDFPENQDLFKRPRIIPGNKSYATAVSEREVDATYEERNYSRQPQRKKIFIIGDSHLTRIKKDSLRKKFKGDKVYFKCFSGANTKQLDHYVLPVLVDEKPQTVVIHIGSNDITKFNYHDVDVNDLANRILQIGLKCRYYGVESIAISSVLVRNHNNLNKLIREVNISLKHLCKVYGFDFICNDRIGKDLLWRDGLHLTDEGTSFLATNFLNFLNSYHEHGNLTD